MLQRFSKSFVRGFQHIRTQPFSTLHIKNLHCIRETNEWGKDNIRLNVWAKQPYVWGGDFKSGTSRNINSELEIDQQAQVVLTEVDSHSRNEFLGFVTIKEKITEDGQLSFRGDGGDYVLEYAILDEHSSDQEVIPAPDKFQLNIKSLLCMKTEDQRTDECQLKITDSTDELVFDSGEFDMQTGNIYDFNQTFNVNGNAYLRLVDKDVNTYLDPDDLLGKQIVLPA